MPSFKIDVNLIKYLFVLLIIASITITLVKIYSKSNALTPAVQPSSPIYSLVQANNGVLSGQARLSSSSQSSASVVFAGQPLLGALGSSESYDALYNYGFREVVISASWQNLEPTQDSFSASATTLLQNNINNAHKAGLSISLDIGSQYAPPWIFQLSPTSHFINQYGDIFTDTVASGRNIPNFVSDLTVRNKLTDYINYLGSHISNIDSVRIGGLSFNELGYPNGNFNSHSNSFWFYDSASQNLLDASVKNWVPGSGTADQAKAFLRSYNNSINSFGIYLVNTGLNAFAQNVKLELMLPGWGERITSTTVSENNLLNGSTDEINQGLDWAELIPQLPNSSRLVMYSTYADATNGTIKNPDPATFIHSLLGSDQLEGGESTGNGNSTYVSANLMFGYSKKWNWYAVNWFFNKQPQTSGQIVSSFNSN